jgi:hypothetical protein
MITYDRLLESLSYDPVTGIFIWVRDPKFYRIKKGDLAGSITKLGYRKIRIDGKIYFAHRLAWYFMMKRYPDCDIDHINGIKDDNRWENLRAATASQNQMNRTKTRSNTSGFKGVYWHEKLQKWQAKITIKKKQIYLGVFSTAEEASHAYQDAAFRLHRDFAKV